MVLTFRLSFGREELTLDGFCRGQSLRASEPAD
jgi:hypothetical protein